MFADSGVVKRERVLATYGDISGKRVWEILPASHRGSVYRVNQRSLCVEISHVRSNSRKSSLIECYGIDARRNMEINFIIVLCLRGTQMIPPELLVRTRKKIAALAAALPRRDVGHSDSVPSVPDVAVGICIVGRSLGQPKVGRWQHIDDHLRRDSRINGARHGDRCGGHRGNR